MNLYKEAGGPDRRDATLCVRHGDRGTNTIEIQASHPGYEYVTACMTIEEARIIHAQLGRHIEQLDELMTKAKP